MADLLIPVVSVPGAGAMGYKVAEDGLVSKWPMMGSGNVVQGIQDGNTIPLSGVVSESYSKGHVPIPGESLVCLEAAAITANWPDDPGDIQFGHGDDHTSGPTAENTMIYLNGGGVPLVKTYGT